jgi:hypothetical protein
VRGHADAGGSSSGRVVAITNPSPPSTPKAMSWKAPGLAVLDLRLRHGRLEVDVPHRGASWL